MNDLINRKKLLDEIDNLTFHATLSFPLKASKIYEIKSVIQKLLDSIIEIIKNSPSESGWISCSERLPENRERVLVCFRSGTVHIAVWYGDYDEKGAWKVTSQFPTKLYRTDTIPKWMPMPDADEPPEEGDNDA